MNIDVLLPSPVTPIEWPFFEKNGLPNSQVSILCKRDDLIHPVISGNKWRKLVPTLSHIRKLKCKHIMSFGGAYSNHLHALSYVCMLLNIQLTAIIRGNYENALTPTLSDMVSWGTNLQFVSKVNYRKRTDEKYCEEMMSLLNADYIIPEGGSNTDCLQGVAELMKECQSQVPDVTHIVLPVASGGTLAGLITAKPLPNVNLIGIGVLKGPGYLENLVNNLLFQQTKTKDVLQNWQILHDYHHGGYAKISQELALFVQQFNQQSSRNEGAHKIVIEPIYSGKCFYAVDQLMRANYFPANSKVMIVHTGGLQGARTVT